MTKQLIACRKFFTFNILNILLIVVFAFCKVGYSKTKNSEEKGNIITVQSDSIKYFINLGDSLIVKKMPLKAKSAFNKAYSLAKKQNNNKLIIKSAFKLGEYMSSIKDERQNAISIYNDLLNYCDKVSEKQCLARSHLNIAKIHLLEEDYQNAIENFNKSLLLCKKLEDSMLLSEVYLFKGVLYFELNDMDNARNEYKKMIEFNTSSEDKYFEVTYLNIGSTFKNPDSIIHYSQKITKYCDQNKSANCDYAFNNIANAYIYKDMLKKALETITNNIDVDNVKYVEGQKLYVSLMHTLGLIYFKMEDYDTSILYHNKSLKYSVEENFTPYIISTSIDLSKSYEKKGDYNKALQLIRNIEPLEEEYNEIKIKKEVANIEALRLLSIKEAKIVNLESENQEIEIAMSKTKLFVYIMIIALILILAFLMYTKHINKLKFYKVNEELSLNRMKSLQAAMNPHFLFNAFSTLQNFILKKEILKANEYMTKLSGLIRTILDNSDSVYVSFNMELDLLKTYVSIEQQRFEEKFDVFYDIDDLLIIENPRIPSMIIQPYIENVFLHGFSYLKKKGLLKISFKENQDTVICIILDNGIGRKESQKIKNKGNSLNHLSIATHNTGERLRILRLLGTKNASVKIIDLIDNLGISEGTKVIIDLPKIKSNTIDR